MTTTRALAVLGVLTMILSGCAAKQKTEETAAKAVARSEAKPKRGAPNKNVAQDPLGARLSGQDSDLFGLMPIYFQFDSARLTPESREWLAKVATYMRANEKVIITIEGHCDDRGTAEYNLALGDQRARSTTDYLATLGVDRQRVQVVSYGEERPAVKGAGEDAWAKNRRAEFVRRRG